MYDTEGRVLHHQRDMCDNRHCNILGVHQAGGIEAAEVALASLEASWRGELDIGI